MLVIECICGRCKYEWVSTKGKMPKACPKCKSYRWNEHKVNPNKIPDLKEKQNG